MPTARSGRWRSWCPAGLMALVVLERTPATHAGVTPLDSPEAMTASGGGGQVFDFDTFPALTPINAAYAERGITFSRDDGDSVFAYDWRDLGRTTTTAPNVLATIVIPGVHGAVTHLNVSSSTPLTAMGAFFGNDQADPDFARIRLSIWDASGVLLGSTEVAANQNTSVDQFIGIHSEVPFTRARFENLDLAGRPSIYNSVVIDDLRIAAVPEPAAIALTGASLLILGAATWRRARRM